MSDESSEQSQLLQRILASRHFAQSEMLKRVLRYLVDHSKKEDTRAISEWEIGTRAVGRPEPFHPREDPIVRVSLSSIRQRLESYFETEGREEPLRLEISKGRYRALFVPNEKGHAGSWVRSFWQPYFDNARPNILVHSEPLFLREPRGARFRDIRLNNPETAPQRAKEIWPELGAWSFQPYYGYLSVGTVYCMLAVIGTFHDAGVAIEPKSPRSCTWQELRHSNVVLIGSAAANSYIQSLEGKGNFELQDDCIGNLDPQNGERPKYYGERYMDGKLPRHKEYALITRRPGLEPDCAVTIIAAFHAKAIEAAGQFVTSEDQLRGLPKALTRNWPDALPRHFQVLIEVEMIDIGDELVNVRATPLTQRVMPVA
ncbi:MAG TPA: hypothetical protein VKB88_38305 [Bryobacteraceae bacterium]|nr:hypothetical protein [Bryobacteraceae bacterium]